MTVGVVANTHFHVVLGTPRGDFRYHLKDVVTGKIYFLLVRIRIKHMELAIIRRESAGTGAPRIIARRQRASAPTHCRPHSLARLVALVTSCVHVCCS